MEILFTANKGRSMNTVESFFCIYKETFANNEINDKNTVKHNVLFETIVQENAGRELTPI
jgi:hypothetical protein